MNTWTVYILHCKDNSIYVGCTTNINERLNRHKNGFVQSTAGKRPVKVVTEIVFRDKYLAYNFEKYLKSGSGRAFMKRHLLWVMVSISRHLMSAFLFHRDPSCQRTSRSRIFSPIAAAMSRYKRATGPFDRPAVCTSPSCIWGKGALQDPMLNLRWTQKLNITIYLH